MQCPLWAWLVLGAVVVVDGAVVVGDSWADARAMPPAPNAAATAAAAMR
jgi:hypothetical protein